MRQMKQPELDARIQAFLDKKRTQFPELETSGDQQKDSKSRGALSHISTALLKPFHIGS